METQYEYLVACDKPGVFRSLRYWIEPLGAMEKDAPPDLKEIDGPISAMVVDAFAAQFPKRDPQADYLVRRVVAQSADAAEARLRKEIQAIKDAARAPALAVLPVPEIRPLREWMTRAFLETELAQTGPLEALRVARVLLNEPEVRGAHLDELFHAAHAALPNVDVKRPLPPDFCPSGTVYKLHVLWSAALEGTGTERVALFAKYRILLRAIRYAFRLQASLFGRADKLGTGEAELNFTPALSGLLHAYLKTFGNTAKRLHGPGLSPIQWEKRPTDWLRLAPTNPVLLAALHQSIGQGVPACCEVAEAAWLIAGYAMSPERLHLFNPIAGDSRSISMAEYHQLYPHIQNLSILEGDLSWLDAQ